MTRIKMSERSNTPDVEVPSVTYAKGYDDPEADMVLRSSDGVLFRVHSYHLKAARSVCPSPLPVFSSSSFSVPSFAP